MGLNLKYFSWLNLEGKKQNYNYLSSLKCFHVCSYFQSHFYLHKHCLWSSVSRWEPEYAIVFSCRVTVVFRDSAVSLVNRRDLFGPGCPSIFQYFCCPLRVVRASTAYTLPFPFLFWAFAEVKLISWGRWEETEQDFRQERVEVQLEEGYIVFFIPAAFTEMPQTVHTAQPTCL